MEPIDETRVSPSQPAAPPGASVTPTSQTETDADGTLIPERTPATQLRAVGLVDVPGYAVRREIARGGMGVVFAAHDPVLDREVAVKVMHAGQDGERFVIESKVTAQLPHPGIPPVYALGTLGDGRPFLAMKLIQGRTLSDELRASDRRTDQPRLLGIFEQICQTVGFAHARGIIHRDLKPANVMVGSFGEVLVMDWGLARVTTDDQKTEVSSGPDSSFNPHPTFLSTQAGEVKGTPAYMAPEQARGEPVDARADVFALGAILAVMLTGKPPFVGDSIVETVQRAAAARLTDCFALLEDCDADPELVAVAKRCLAPNAAARYADGEAVAEAVASYRAGVEERLRQAERDRAVSAAEAREQRKRRKVQLALAAAVGLFLAVGGGFAWWQDRRETERTLKAEHEEADRKATETRLAGERDLEQRLKAEQARQGVRASLALATDLRKQYKFKAAETAVNQAVALASGAPELLPEVEAAKSDLAFVAQLDDIRYRKWLYSGVMGTKGSFSTQIAAPEYRKAFATHTLDLTTLPTDEAARRIASSAVKADLIAAVDDWSLYEPDDAVRVRLLEIARRADPDPWRDRLRDPAVRGDNAAVAKLAADAGPANPSSAALSVLAALMERRELDPGPLLSAARAKYPTNFELAFTLGLWYSLNNQADPRQITPYEVALALRPENPTVWNNLGGALGNIANLDAARLVCGGAIAHHPKNATLHYNLGVVLQRKGEDDAAIASFKEALSIKPDYAEAFLTLGGSLEAKGDRDGAIAAYREAVKHAPTYAPAHNNLGNVLKRTGNVEGAIAAYREGIKHDPTNAIVHFNLGVLLYEKRDFEGAIAAYKDAIKHDPGYTATYNNLAAAYFEKGDVDGAIAAFRDAIKHEPRSGRNYQNLGLVLRRKGDKDAAIAAFRESIKLEPAVASVHENLGDMLHSKGDLDGAVGAWKEAVKLDPSLAQTQFHIAAVHVNQGKFADAIPFARNAVKASPKSGIAYAVLGAALEGTGDRSGARAAFAEAAKLDPGRFGELLKRLPLEVAPPPREVKGR